MSLELIGKFIGADEIESIKPAEVKTPEGKDVMEVTFKNKKKYIYPVTTLELVVTDELSDASTVQQKKMTPMIRQVLGICAEYDLSVSEIEMLFKQIGSNLDLAFNRATNQIWFGDDTRFAPGFDPMNDVSLLMAHSVLSKIDANKNAKENS